MLLALTAWIALLALPAGALAGPQAPPVAAAPCRVVRNRRRRQTRAGVAGALVTLRGPSEAASAPDQPAPDRSARNCASGCDAAADPDGRFVIAGLAPGEYTVSASVTGFSESVPSAITLARVGPACEATVEIPYSLQMRAESKAELPGHPRPR